MSRIKCLYSKMLALRIHPNSQLVMFWGANFFSPAPEQFWGRVFDPGMFWCSGIYNTRRLILSCILIPWPIPSKFFSKIRNFHKILSNGNFVSSLYLFFLAKFVLVIHMYQNLMEGNSTVIHYISCSLNLWTEYNQ